jgi:uncharacterized protein (TIGR00251 family)
VAGKNWRRTLRGGDSRTLESARCPAWLGSDDHGLLLRVHLQPGARQTAIRGEHGGRLKIAVASPPIDGRANSALTKWLAEQLGLPSQSLRITAGEHSRDKTIRVSGIDLEFARLRLAPK